MSSAMPTPRPGVLKISPYIPGRSTAMGGTKTYKLSSNETPLGPSPMAIEAFKAASAHLEDYPDGASTNLRNAIGHAFGLNPDRIICGAGSDEILNLVAHAYVGPGDEAIYSEYGFLVYKIAITGCGGEPVVAPERNFTVDVDAILDRVTAKTRLIFLANPNNPTGTYLPFTEVRRLHAALPAGVLLVLDAAYSEYIRRNDYESGMELAATAPNVLMTRTFSKIYGLANLRLGWCYGPAHVIDAMNRIRGPFNVSGPAQEAGIAALADKRHTDNAVLHNETWLPRVSAAIDELGLEVVPSVGNFILIRFPQKKGRTAADANAFLLKRGVILRDVSPYGLPEGLRMTIGSEEANKATVTGLADFLKAAG